MKKLFTFAILFSLYSIYSPAQTNSKLFDIPTSENVLSNVKGTDKIDTFAKQRATLYVLWEIAFYGMTKNYYSDNDLKKIIDLQKAEYNSTMRLVYEKYLNEAKASDSKENLDKFGVLWKKYFYHTPDFKANVIESLFNEKAKNQYYLTNGYSKKNTVTATTSSKTTQKTTDGYDNTLKAEAAYNIGLNLFTGESVEQSYEKSWDYFHDAAELGNTKALLFMGWMHSHGLGATKDYKIANEYYKKAEENKVALGSAYYDMGKIYFYGQGIEKDPQMALGYFSKASNLGNADAQYSLGYMYANGISVNQNYQEAFQWFYKAAQQKNTKAYVYLGYMYLNGQGVETDNKKALELLQFAADKNNYEGQFYVGWMYANDKVSNANYENALPFYLSLVKKGINTLSKQNRTIVYNTIVKIYSAQNKNNEAIEFAQFVRESNPDDLDFDFIMLEANLYFSANNKGKFVQLLKEAMVLDPSNEEVPYNLGVMAYEQNNYVEAATYYRKVLDLNPLHENANINQAALLTNLGNSLVEQMNSLGNTKVEDEKYNELKEKRNKLYKTAIPFLEKIISFNKESKNNAINSLINIYESLGDTENASKTKKLLN
jgi:TPR repeat protein